MCFKKGKFKYEKKWRQVEFTPSFPRQKNNKTVAINASINNISINLENAKTYLKVNTLM